MSVIQTRVMPAKDLLVDRQFIIPDIQRDYAWRSGANLSGDDSATQMIQDLIKFYHNYPDGEEQYFLGTVIAFTDEDTSDFFQAYKLQLFDGQQRISSLTALMLVIRSILDRSGLQTIEDSNGNTIDLHDTISEIQHLYMMDDSTPPNNRLEPKDDYDRECLQMMLGLLNGNLSAPQLKEWMDEYWHHTPKGLILAACRFHTELTRECQLDDNPRNIAGLQLLYNFYRCVSDRLLFNLTLTDDMGMAFQIFKTANGRGDPLTAFDLFKGFIVQRHYFLGLENDRSRTALLNQCQESVNRFARRESNTYDGDVKRFMQHWVGCRTGTRPTEQSVVAHIERQIDEVNSWEGMRALLHDFLHHSNAWGSEIIPAGRDCLSSGLAGWVSYRRLHGAKMKQADMLYLALRAREVSHTYDDEIDESDVFSIMDLLDNFVQRVALSTGGATHVRAELSHMCVYAHMIWRGDAIDEVWRNLFVYLEERSQRNPRGFDALCDSQLGREQALVILHSIDEVANANYDPGLRTRECRVIQLLPESPNQIWDCAAEEANPGVFSQQIGNWFLIRGTNNQGLSQQEVRTAAGYGPEQKIQLISQHTTATQWNDIPVTTEDWVQFISERTSIIVELLESMGEEDGDGIPNFED